MTAGCACKYSLPGCGAAAAHDAVVGREKVARVRDKKVAVDGRAANGRRAGCTNAHVLNS